MQNINLKTIKPQFMAQAILALRGDKAIKQTVSDLRARFNVQNRPFDKTDFYEICQSEEILVLDNLLEFYALRGVYMWNIGEKKGKGIFINRYLTKQNYLKVAFHELGHHFLHRFGRQPLKHYFDGRLTLNHFIKEAQANYFSDLMLSEVKRDER